jgi:hypothetical protein
MEAVVFDSSPLVVAALTPSRKPPPKVFKLDV